MSLCLDVADTVLKPYEFKMEEIEGFRYRCRVSIFNLEKGEFILFVIDAYTNASDVFKKLCFLCVGRHALSDQAGSERGPTEGDQAGTAQFRKTQGE